MTSTEQELDQETTEEPGLASEPLDPVNSVGGRFHAATIPPDGGPEQCLGCGKPWPCSDAPAPTVSVAPLGQGPDPADVLAAAAGSRIPWPLVADQLGVPREDVQALLDAETG